MGLFNFCAEWHIRGVLDKVLPPTGLASPREACEAFHGRLVLLLARSIAGRKSVRELLGSPAWFVPLLKAVSRLKLLLLMRIWLRSIFVCGETGEGRRKRRGALCPGNRSMGLDIGIHLWYTGIIFKSREDKRKWRAALIQADLVYWLYGCYSIKKTDVMLDRNKK